MRHRIFIAINLPKNVKKKLLDYQNKIEELFTPYQTKSSGAGFAPYRNEVSGAGPIRWVKPENWHITLAFLGFLSEQELLEVLKITREVALRNRSFSINLERICYGPPKKPARPPKFPEIVREEKEWEQKFGRPRMVWVEGEKNQELERLQKDLENFLLASSIKGIEKPEVRPYAPHITLGRIKQWEFRQIEPEERPIIDEDISLNFEVNSIEVMESQLKGGGAEYTILESTPLKT